MRIPPPYRQDGRGELCEAEHDQVEECSRSYAAKGCCLLAAFAIAMAVLAWGGARAVLG